MSLDRTNGDMFLKILIDCLSGYSQILLSKSASIIGFICFVTLKTEPYSLVQLVVALTTCMHKQWLLVEALSLVFIPYIYLDVDLSR